MTAELIGDRLVVLGTYHPIGAVFEAMTKTGLYRRFIGLSQVVTGIIVLIPRLAPRRRGVRGYLNTESWRVAELLHQPAESLLDVLLDPGREGPTR